MSERSPDTNRWLNLTPFRAVRLIIVVATTLAVVAAILQRLVDPAFDTFGEAAWWAISTVSTVGYGDIVPESAAGRFIAAGLMLLGLALIPTLTSIVVSTLIANRTRRLQADVDEDRANLRALAKRIDERLERIERTLGSPK